MEEQLLQEALEVALYREVLILGFLQEEVMEDFLLQEALMLGFLQEEVMEDFLLQEVLMLGFLQEDFHLPAPSMPMEEVDPLPNSLVTFTAPQEAADAVGNSSQTLFIHPFSLYFFFTFLINVS